MAVFGLKKDTTVFYTTQSDIKNILGIVSIKIDDW